MREQQPTGYIIRGGMEGRERLRVLSRTMRPATLALLDRAGVGPGMICLDVGCGGGDVSIDLANLVGPTGRVIGIDADDAKIAIARQESQARGVANVEFRVGNALEADFGSDVDVAHLRFLLSHLKDAPTLLSRIRRALKAGGTIVVADTDFSGHFSYPASAAFQRYVELYAQTLRRRGGDANIGVRLPTLLRESGFTRIQAGVSQPAGVDGDAKLMAALTLENIAESVVAEGLASRAEMDGLIAELHALARDGRTLASAARVVEAWAVA